MFKRFFAQAEIYNSFGKLPRVHDLRHSYCVHALQQMVEKGMDIYCTLPFLSSFMGHQNIYSTEKYLRLVEENFSELIGGGSNEK